MLIGISGKMGSGKNLVCTIIQGLTAAKKHNIENPSFEWIKKYYINSIWEQKAFAGKLKDMVCMLIGCTREQLEDREFKEKELGEEWWYTYGRIGNVPPITIAEIKTALECLLFENDLEDKKIKIPEDVSVTGFDDSVFGKNFRVPLTTIKHPQEKLGEEAAKLLLKLMRGTICESEEIHVLMEPELIIRDSTR